MKKVSFIGFVVAFCLLFAGVLFAADPYDTQTNPSMRGGQMQDMSSTPGMTSTTSQIKIDRTSKIIGMSVKNPQGDSLGSIKDITIDDKSGRVAYAVLGAGGALGVGGKYYAIPWKALSFSAAGDSLILNVDKERLKNAPGFDKNNWPDFANQQWGAEVHRFYGQQPYWEESPMR